MYSYEQRVTAVKLLIQYDMSYLTVIQELGYPNNSKSLCYWFKEYESNGDFHKAYAINVKINMPKNSHINMYNLSC